MAKDKSTLNPATAALKADKARTIKRSKAQQTKQLTEKLARRNPERLQKQIDELKQQAETAPLRPKDKQTLEELERDVRRIRKAKDVLGDKGRGERMAAAGGDRGVLGKRTREGGGGAGWQQQQQQRRERAMMEEGESSATDEDAREIPMPKDVQNMPPMPRRRTQQRPQSAVPATSANNTPLGGGGRADYRADYRAEQLQRRGERAGATPATRADMQDQEQQETGSGQRRALPAKPAPAQTVYSAAPQIRNLQKEAVSAFVPSSVAQKIAAAKGAGARLVEPEEADRLEREGYMAAGGEKAAADEAVQQAALEAEKELEYGLMAREEVADGLEEEERRFAREVRHVEMEEVEDEDM
jgi:WW domain binding protein 11